MQGDIFPTWWSILKNPIMAYECFFVPLTVRCLKLSTELGASAELRGLDSSNPVPAYTILVLLTRTFWQFWDLC